MRSEANKEGQSLVEFALFVPILALLLSGLSAFGFLLYAHVQVANAAREGARAGSLYLGGRFKYTSCFATAAVPCPTGYGTGGSNPSCWNLNQWVENSLAEVIRQSNGCPETGSGAGNSTIKHSFGLLSATKCSAAITSDCWLLEELTITPPAPASPTTINGSGTPPNNGPEYITTRIGDPLTVKVLYRFNVPFFGTMFNVNPINIQKTVIMRIQNN